MSEVINVGLYGGKGIFWGKDKSDRYPNLNSKWEWDGEFSTYKSGYVSSVSISKDYEIDQFKLRPSEKTVVEITSNDQVTDETVFVN